MQQITKTWMKYFLFAGVFTACINLIYLGIPFYMMVVYDRALFSFSRATLYTLSAGVLTCLVVMAALDYLRMRLRHQAGNDIAARMRPFVFRQMQKEAVLPAVDGYKSGWSDLERLRVAIGSGRIFYLIELVWIPVFLAVLYLLHPLPGLVAAGSVLLAAGFQALVYYAEKRRYTLADTARNAGAGFSAAALVHARLVASMKMAPRLEERIVGNDEKAVVILDDAGRLHAAAGSAVRMLHLAGPAAVFCAGAFAFINEEVTVGVIFAGAMITVRIFQPLEGILERMKEMAEAAAAYRRLKMRVETQPEEERLSLPAPEGRVEVDKMTLTVGGKPVLHNIRFSLEPGESLGIFGPASVGKTALCRALLGVWAPAAGDVRLDKANISHWPEEELGRYLGYLPQDPQLLPGTVADNISRFSGQPAEKTVRAARAANAHELVLKLPQGYDTQVAAGGSNLSAGERQMISLARALYNDPKFVVMDEPFTHLDDAGVKRAVLALNSLKQARVTHVVVTRQPNLLANMDRVLMLKEGQVAMYGPPKEVFAQIAKQQQAASGAAPRQTAGVIK